MKSNERYKIITSGKLLPNVEYAYFENAVKEKTKIPSEKIHILADGKIKLLKKQISFCSAKEYKNLFTKVGLEVFIHVDFSKESFLDGLVENDTHSNDTCNKTLFIKSDQISPAIFYPSKEIIVQGDNNQQGYTFSVNSIVGLPLVYLLTLLSAFIVQSYLLKYLSSTLEMRTGTMVIGIIVFFSIILYFPLLILNKRKAKIKYDIASVGSYCLKSFNHMDVVNINFKLIKNGTVISVIKKNRYKKLNVEAKNDKNHVMYRAMSPELFVDSAKSSASDVATQLITSRLLEYYYFFVNIVDFIKFFIKPPPETTTKGMSILCLIVNDENKVSARVYKGVNIAIEMDGPECDEDKLTMIYMVGFAAAGLN